MYEGLCFGGPLHGEIWQSRFPKGFLLVDKPKNQCWIYDWNVVSGSFTVRGEGPMPVLTEGQVNRYRAAEEFNYDVIAAPWEAQDVNQRA
jgi:hypothetical protein